MKEVNLKRVWFSRARNFTGMPQSDRDSLDDFLETLPSGTATVDVKISDFPKSFWRAILRESALPPANRTAIALYTFGMDSETAKLEDIYEHVVSDPPDFGNTLQLAGIQAPNCEMYLNGRWYPVLLTVSFHQDSEKITKSVSLHCSMLFGEKSFSHSHHVSPGCFTVNGEPETPRRVIDILEDFGYRRVQVSASEFNLRLVKSERMACSHGRVVKVSGSVIAPSQFSWWSGFETNALGTSDMPARCIVEPALEIDVDGRQYYYGSQHQGDENKTPLPFVRVFSLETKAYVYADIDDIDDYEFDVDALNRLHLPTAMHSILARVFGTPVERMFGDLLRGKHGGAVVLASGRPGVGKTLTAEIYAETTERPLYVMELGELGTTASEVEEKLQRVFARVTRWNAVLQFDECEIFLSKRGTDLERSAIVGIFLRLLDYYRGLLFLTTNRPDVLDDAVLSRVMLRLDYPDLDIPTRAAIWRSMFNIAELHLKDIEFEKLATLELNGRQIRNLTRLAKIVYPDGVITAVGLREVLLFGCGISLDDVAE